MFASLELHGTDIMKQKIQISVFMYPDHPFPQNYTPTGTARHRETNILTH